MIFDEEITTRLANLGFALLNQCNLTDKYLQIAALDPYVSVNFDKIVEVEDLLGYDFLGCIPDLSNTIHYGTANTLTFKKAIEENP